MFSETYDILETKAVGDGDGDGDIDPDLKTENIRQKIRDNFMSSASVTVVLIGSETWKIKHIDWEIASSISQTKSNARTGLLGILLPTYPRNGTSKYDPCTIPPRLHDNIECGFAEIHNCSTDPNDVQGWIHEAFNRRKQMNPDNSRGMFGQNRSSRSDGWC